MMPAEPPSLRHVADLAGVSVATASRVMSGSKHPVSDSTRHRVLEAADRLSFEPNRLARGLVTAKSQTIGVLVHDISDPYFGDIVKGLEDGIHGEDYSLFVASSDRNSEKELSCVRAFHSHQVDAIVFAASSLTDPEYQLKLSTIVERFQSRGGLVLILSDHFLDGPRVRFDNHRAILDMMTYLVSQGHSRIGLIGGPPDLEVSRVRLEGYRTALNSLGLEDDPHRSAEGHFTVAGGADAMARLLDQSNVTAVLAVNDLMAIGATRHLVANGYRVPEDISVAGIDDISLAECAPVPLTTLKVPTYRFGQEGAAMLLEMLGGGMPDDRYLEGSVMERESVRALPEDG